MREREKAQFQQLILTLKMQHIKRSAISSKPRWTNLLKPHNGLCSFVEYKPTTCVSDVRLADFLSKLIRKTAVDKGIINGGKRLQGVWKSGCVRHPFADSNRMTTDMHGVNGISVLIRRQWSRECMAGIQSPFQVTGNYRTNIKSPCFLRTFSSTASERRGEKQSETKKDVSTIEDPFDAPTNNIPDKPVTFAEGVMILAGLGVAAVAGYAVFNELIFDSNKYKIFGKALERIQNDSQVRVRIGSPITGYGQESSYRADRQKIPSRMWTDENDVEHVEINFHIRGPRGAGIVYAVMYKDKEDKQWKYTSLIVQIKSPSPTQLILESYIPR